MLDNKANYIHSLALLPRSKKVLHVLLMSVWVFLGILPESKDMQLCGVGLIGDSKFPIEE